MDGARTVWEGPLTEDADLCFYHSERGIEELEGCTPQGSIPVKELAELGLVSTEPCFVRTANRLFRMEQEGFYRFCVMPDTIRHRILFRGNLPRFAGAVCRLHIHGWRDHHLSTEEQIAKSELTVISVACGYIREVGRVLFGRQGIEARRVSTLTMDRWNTYSCGHALFEYRDPREKRWVLADSDFGVMFRAEGSFLDADTVCRRVRRGQPYEIVAVTSGMELDLDQDIDARIAFCELAMSPFGNPVHMRRFFDRVFQVPQLGNDFSVDTEGERARFDALCATQKLKYDFLAPREFREKYHA